MKPFESSHQLAFEVAPWERDASWTRFRVGTCSGLWNYTGEAYQILTIDNAVKGNGHFEDVLEWFENSCRRDHKKLRILELWNSAFKHHLIRKRGFVLSGPDDVEKPF